MESINLPNEEPTRLNLLIGQVIEERYLVKEKIGQGGVGAVYLAEDLKMMKRQVVIKVLLENWLQNADVRRKFEHEKEALARLDHPGIVHILDAGMMADDKPYIVMPFIAGRTLRKYLANAGFLPISFCLDVIKGVTDALAAAHAGGILHRDIKPDNIIITEQPDNSIRVRLIDFGIARVTDSQIAPITEVERSVGTVLYIAPEQLLGSLEQTPAADIYSCGILVYELLTERLPFNPHSVIEMWQMQSDSAIRLPSEIRPELTAVIDSVILKALSFKPEARFQNITDFGSALRQELENLSDKRIPDFEQSMQTFVMTKAAVEVPETESGGLSARSTDENLGTNTAGVQIEQRENSSAGLNRKTDATLPADSVDFQPGDLPIPKETNNYQKTPRRTFIGVGIAGLALVLTAAASLIFVFNQPKVEPSGTETANRQIGKPANP
ncbi:MAG: serine/threonine protein kinase, partial [Pyrinomonadaceae bacterium]|nr:serine/threonine protein kinase [Pyrinomonadaceae bacterium]